MTSELNEKFDSALKLLAGETTTLEKFHSAQKLLNGLDPRIDKKLETVSKALSAYEKLSEGNVIQLTANYLPEHTEKDKKNKKALLFLIRSWNDLKSEVNRVRNELKNNNQGQNQTIQYGKIAKFAKGPFGIITLIAVVMVGYSLLKPNSQQNSNTNTVTSPSITQNNKPKIKIIVVQGKQIPLDQLRIGQGPECLDGTTQAHHYHANTGTATALDGTSLTDPGGCGFGKVKDVKVIEIETNKN